nr:replication factor A protein 1-like [Ipomoea batatas]
MIGGFPAKLVDFLIEDNMENCIMCTLWDEHVSTVMPYFNKHVEGPLTILMQLCRAKTVNNQVRISSSYNATKIVFNGDSKEFLDFKASLKSNQTPLRSNHSMFVLSYGNSIDSHSNSKMIVSTISDIYDRAQDSVEIPSEVESLRSKAMVFKVSVKNDQLSNPAKPIPVLKIVNDDDLVSTYCTSWTDDQDQLSKMSDEEEGDSESEGSESGDEASSPALDQTEKTISDKTNDQMEPGSTKRCLLHQFSSSQDFKRSKYVIIKQEKK